MKKINFKQPKYIFPLVLFLPCVFLAYVLSDMFGGKDDVAEVPTDRINMELPEARTKGVGDKLSSMNSRYNKDNAFSEIEAIGIETEEKESIGDDDLNAMIEEAQRLEEERRKMEELQEQIARSQKSLPSTKQSADESYNRYLEELQRIQRNSRERREEINKPDPAEEARRLAEEKARLEQEERERNRPMIVTRANSTNSGTFNTVTAKSTDSDKSLIRAMIDQTTKATDGTRLRFKLLDDVIVDDVKLLKGTYLYGTVSGFGQQRVMANINNILVGDRFLKVDLSVFDNDGMEGFYVPASAFRDFMKQAGSSALGTNVQINSGGYYGSSLNGESLALQALQNIYNAGRNALQSNIRKNRAKIKYNTVVYLINSREAR